MEKHLKILILEDVPEDAGLVERVLRRENISFTSHLVDTKEEFIAGIRDFKPDVILSDHLLPQFNSSQALAICKQAGLQIPFILVTGAVSEEFAVKCLKQGADDYVLKANLSRLPSAILSSLKQREGEQKRKVAEQILRKQNEELIKINKELDQFVYSVSHNLRAPLMSVLGLLNIARKDLQEDNLSRFLEYFKRMAESVNKLDETLKEIIDYSRNSRTEVRKEEVNVIQLMEDCFAKLKYLEGAENMELVILGRDVGPVYSDPYRLSVIFTNILSNAIKYRDADKAKQFIRIEFRTAGEKAVITVEDNGIGISDELLPRIFEMFYRANEKSQGAGLGLYIAKQMLEILGGSIMLESTIQVGTICTMDIPCDPTDELQPLFEMLKRN